MVTETNNHTTTTTLKRRNSIPPAIVLIPPRKHKTAHPTTTNGNHRSPPLTSTTSFDYELVSLKYPASDSYTSLKDILPSSPSSSILSPTPTISLAGVSSSPSGSSYEISIRNRLVKQAAWAYLQPSSSSPPSSSSRHLCFFSGHYFRQLLSDLRRVVSENLARAYDWLVDALWLFLCR